ncbi:MAG: hypothetical protein KAQ94_02695 [Arcobacteraceae bacterium]|nr:hypothetical protein [Arcobacteraceae bacterium]
MKKTNNLVISKAYKFNNDILQTKVINNELYISDNNSLYKIEGNQTKRIKQDVQYFLNAFDQIENKTMSIHLKNNTNELIYEHETIFKVIIHLSKKENIKEVFLFYNVGSAAIQFDDNSIDIYLLSDNNILTNISFDEDIEYIYKSYTTHELIITLKSKIIFLDILTLKTNKEVIIDKKDFVGVNYLNNKIYIIYKRYLKLIDDNSSQTIIEVDIDSDISKIFVNRGLNELIIVTQTNDIFLYHILTDSIFLIYNYPRKVQDIRFIDYDFYIVSKNLISITDTTKGILELKKHLLLEDIEGSLNVIQKNPFLFLENSFFNKIEEFWNDSFKDISNKLFMNKPQVAKEIFEKFTFINSYKSDYDNIITSKDVFLNISKSLRALKYGEVFQLLEENSFIKTTPIGKKIIYDWDYIFNKFIGYILQHDFDENSKEYKSIKKYESDSSKKELIATVIENQHVILTAFSAYRNKNFLVYSMLSKKYPFFKYLPITKNLEKISTGIYNKVLNYIETEDFEKALNSIRLLNNFDNFKNKSEELKEKTNVIIGFKSSYERNDTTRCRIFLEQYEEYFQYSEYYYTIVNDDFKKMDLAITNIKNDMFETAYKILKEFFQSDIWTQKIKYIMIEYYKQRFKSVLANLNEDSVELYIDNFYKLFGYVDNAFVKDTVNTRDNIKIKQIKKISYYPKDLLDPHFKI